jgi:hypothetical protein
MKKQIVIETEYSKPDNCQVNKKVTMVVPHALWAKSIIYVAKNGTFFPYFLGMIRKL